MRNVACVIFIRNLCQNFVGKFLMFYKKIIFNFKNNDFLEKEIRKILLITVIKVLTFNCFSNGISAMVEQSTLDPKFKGLNPAYPELLRGREKKRIKVP